MYVLGAVERIVQLKDMDLKTMAGEHLPYHVACGTSLSRLQ